MSATGRPADAGPPPPRCGGGMFELMVADPGLRRAGAAGPERRRVRLHLLAGHRPGGYRRRPRYGAPDRRPVGHHLPGPPRPVGQGGAPRAAGGRDPHPGDRRQRRQGRRHAHRPSAVGPGAVDRHRGIGAAHRRGRRTGRPASGPDRVAVASFGDGATGTGSFHEAVNLAALWSCRWSSSARTTATPR